MDEINVVKNSWRVKMQFIEPPKRRLPKFIPFVLGVVGMLILTLIIVSQVKAENSPPANLWKGLIAESAEGDYSTYLIIASVVRNRLDAGMNHGLVAMKRKNLDSFVSREIAYAKTRGKDLKALAEKAIAEVFSGKDYAYGATYYEHTKIYGMPKFWKNFKIVGLVYRGQKKEISLARAR
jgi:hypothetical protein